MEIQYRAIPITEKSNYWESGLTGIGRRVSNRACGCREAACAGAVVSFYTLPDSALVDAVTSDAEGRVAFANATAMALRVQALGFLPLWQQPEKSATPYGLTGLPTS